MTGPERTAPRQGRGHRLARSAALVACAFRLAGLAAGCARHHREARTQEEFRQRFEKITDKTLKKLDATDEQKAKIRPIADDLANALWGFREEHRAIRDRFVKAFEAQKVDPAEISKIRTDALALADKASARFTESLVKAAEVLTPEQRGKLASHWKKCR